MLKEYISLNRLVRTIFDKFIESNSESDSSMGPPNLRLHKKIILDDLNELRRLWPNDLDRSLVDDIYQEVDSDTNLALEVSTIFAMPLLVDIMKQLENYFSDQGGVDASNDILDLLHPIIIKNAYHHFTRGHYREAVLNAFMAVFDLLKENTNLDLDGAKLAQTAYSLTSPILIVSTMRTESGKSEQSGFMNLLVGAYSSIRNPKAHSLEVNPNKLVAAQNLIFASLLARRIEESKTPLEDQP